MQLEAQHFKAEIIFESIWILWGQKHLWRELLPLVPLAELVSSQRYMRFRQT